MDLEVRFRPDARLVEKDHHKAERERDKDKERPPVLKWEEVIAIKVNNGPDKMLLVTGAVSPTACAFVPRKIDILHFLYVFIIC